MSWDKKFAAIAVLVLLAGCVALVAWKRTNSRGYAAAPFSGLTAYKSEYLIHHGEPVSRDRLSTKRVVAVSASGETSELIEEVNSKEKAATRMVNARGRAMQVYQHLGIYYSYPEGMSRPEATARRLGDPGTGCAKTMDGRDNVQAGTKVGEEQILGFRVVRYRSPDRTTWLAPDLGCFEIQAEYTWAAGASGLRTVTFQTTDKVDIGPPAESLFTEPAHARRVKPAEGYQAVVAARLRAAGVPEADVRSKLAAMAADQSLQALDRRAAQ